MKKTFIGLLFIGLSISCHSQGTTPNLNKVLKAGNDGGGKQIKNISTATVTGDVLVVGANNFTGSTTLKSTGTLKFLAGTTGSLFSYKRNSTDSAYIKFDNSSSYTRGSLSSVSNFGSASILSNRGIYTTIGAIGTGGTASSFYIDSAQATLSTNFPTFVGITYTSDFSTNYTSRSLVDSAFVGTVVNGLWKKTGNDIYNGNSGDVQIGADLKMLDNDKSILFRNHTLTSTFDKVISIPIDNTILIGDVNNNGVAILPEKEFKGKSGLGNYYLRFASVDSNNTVNISSGNALETRFYTGGMSSDYALSLVNGGNAFLKKKLLIGSLGGSVMGGEIDIADEQIDAGSGTAGIGLASYRNSDVWGSYVYGVRYRGSFSSPATVQTGDVLMEFGCLGWDGTNALGGGELMWTAEGTVSTGIIPSRVELLVTNTSGTTTPGIKIGSDLSLETFGKVGIKTTIPDSTLTITGGIHSTGGANFGGDLKYNFIHGVGSADAQTTYTLTGTQNVYYKIAPSFTVTESDGLTLAGDSIIIATAGDYQVSIWVGAGTSISAENLRILLYVNDIDASSNLGRFIFNSAGVGLDKYWTRSYMWYKTLSANDRVSFYIANISSSNTITVADFKIYIEKKPE